MRPLNDIGLWSLGWGEVYNYRAWLMGMVLHVLQPIVDCQVVTHKRWEGACCVWRLEAVALHTGEHVLFLKIFLAETCQKSAVGPLAPWNVHV